VETDNLVKIISGDIRVFETVIPFAIVAVKYTSFEKILLQAK